MSRILTITISFFISTLLFSCNVLNQKDERSIRIMPLGNSITQADSNHSGYRYPLWKLLKEGGYDVDFVGSMSTNKGGENPATSFDTDHEGHWGWRADQILNGFRGQGKLADLLKLNTPDIVLMHLGSNDIFQGETIQEIEADITKIISELISSNKDIIILIAQLLPVAENQVNKRIRMLNKIISKLHNKISVSEKQLIVVNQFEDFNPDTDTYDGVHPNVSGEEKMAKKWYVALQSVINRKY